MTIRCCVCGLELGEGQVHTLGGRPFCATHHAKALRATEASWSRAGLVEAARVAAFLALVAAIFGESPLPGDALADFALALVPAAIWGVFVYRQDRLEPEPPGHVLGVAALGALLAHAITEPLMDFLGAHEWRALGGPGATLAALVQATLQLTAAYVAVRTTVFRSEELDEPVDAIVYATAAALGAATVANVRFLLGEQGLLPLAGATFVANTVLAHVAAAVVLGYGLGRARFDGAPGGRWLTACFAVAVVVQTVAGELALRAGTREASFAPWTAFAVTASLGVAVLAGTHFLAARHARRVLDHLEPVGVARG